MKSRSRWIVGFSFLLFAMIPSHAQSCAAELKLGVAAYKNSRYEEASHHFQKAIELDPANITARLYLATTDQSQFIPGVETPENIDLADQAIDQYQHVLDSDANHSQKVSSVKGIAYLYLIMKKFDEAKKYYQMASDLDKDDPEPYYSIGVIDWTECYQRRMEARARLGMRPEEHLDAKDNDQKRVCDELRVKNTPSIEEGIESLYEAIEHRPDYDDAMAYLNLMFREKADVECDDPAARKRDLRTADEWVDHTMAIKKAKAMKVQPVPPSTAPNPQ
jgi:tetratricopeptide (TPR) repeat protein